MSRRPLLSTPRADEDIRSAIDGLRVEAGEEVATALVDELARAFDLIAEHPAIGSTRFAVELELDALRHVALRRFPYLVLYLERTESCLVVRVLHSRRDIPTELQERSRPGPGDRAP